MNWKVFAILSFHFIILSQLNHFVTMCAAVMGLFSSYSPRFLNAIGFSAPEIIPNSPAGIIHRLLSKSNLGARLFAKMQSAVSRIGRPTIKTLVASALVGTVLGCVIQLACYFCYHAMH
ncbi:uncharacterized protein LOC131938589 [Physella acuta]|uniref:uncharacterized protein LOC131938589 n=1 Tax=Physella acuta TaxID=109671 RepID=UPI0027DB081C|nr:uncharacterized protein LOC131938589 [Physella acuta]